MRRCECLLIMVLLVGCARTSASPDTNTTAPSPVVPTDFAVGILAAASATTVQLTVTGAADLRLLVRPQTQICRGDCTAQWTDLRPGDRVATGFFRDAQGNHVVRWMNANVLSQYGTVTAIASASVTIAPNTGRDGDVERELIVGPKTSIHYLDSIAKTGVTSHLAVGDHLYFTGTADSPDMRVQRVWAQRIDQTIAAPAMHP